MKTRHTLVFRLYLGIADLCIGTGITLLYYWATRKPIFLWMMPLAYAIIANLGNWIKTKVKIANLKYFPWYYGLQWPPHWFIGRVFYDGWHYVAQFGPVWIGREP